jgi:digeranylgeranylglycerophospholipid reductase
LYDLVVVGAGPAGSMMAKTAAEKGLNVLLMDRKREVGVPDKCGEFLPSLEEMKRLAPDAKELDKLFDPPNSCIVNRSKNVKFIFPNDREISVPFRGIVVERKLYDKHLANEAARAGADIALLTRAVDLLEDGRGVKAKNIEGSFEIQSRTIAGADGAYSLVARRAGMSVSRNPMDYSVGYQYEMVDVDHDPEYVEMYLGEDIAPGTYAWIIPKGSDIANVGTGIRAPFMKKGMNVRDYQRNFVEKNKVASRKLLKARPTAIKAGCIPVGGPMRRTSTENVIVVGDAAGHTIPTVGGGIPPALICGRIAGQAVAEYLIDDKPLTLYDRSWREQMGTVLENSLRLRKMSDIFFENRRMIELVTNRGWLTEEMIEKFILCKIDTNMKLVEKTLSLMKRL